MYSLIIDTATKKLYIALVKDENIVFEKYILGFNDHAKNIVIVIEEALKQENIQVNDLNRVIVGNGPGSYTGVRMGVVVGKMFASFSDIDLYSISTLFLMSSGYEGSVLPLIDARRGNVFASLYNDCEVVVEESLYNKEELFSSITINYLIIDEDNMKACPFKIIKYAKKEEFPDAFVPNYLRETEAVRNKNAN